MPKPENPLDLIRWDDGAPRFNAGDATGIPDWWDHYNEARLFFLVCAQDLARGAGMANKAVLHQFIPAALDDIPAAWQRTLPHPSNWEALNPSKLLDAIQQEPLGLIKALQVATVIEHFLVAQGVDTTDYWDHVHIKPATYRIVQDEARLSMPPGGAAGRLAAIGQGRSGRIVSEYSAGKHVCFASAQAMIGTATGLAIDYARRRGRRGAISTASHSLEYPCLNAA